jgi:hypothetical protein
MANPITIMSGATGTPPVFGKVVARTSEIASVIVGIAWTVG